ncbi:MAG: Putative oxidoreductase, partial [uncultured Acetobacteraceae bacterium]
GLPPARTERPAGLAPLPRRHDVRRRNRRADLRPHRRQSARAGRQLHRHRRRLQRGALGGGGRPRHPGRPRLVGAGHQTRQPHRARPERPRPVAAALPARRRGQPAPPRHGRHRHPVPAQGGPRHAAGGDGARDGRPGARRQDPPLRRLQLSRLARGRDLPPVRRLRRRPARGQPALLQRPQSHAGGGAPAGLRALRLGRGALQPARPRRLDRQVPARGAAAGGHPSRAVRQAHGRNGVAAGEPRHRAGDRPARGGARHHRRPVCGRLGAEQPLGGRGHCRAAHRSAVGRLRRRPRLPLHRRGRGAGGPLGRTRAPFHARLQRPRLPARGTRAARRSV